MTLARVPVVRHVWVPVTHGEPDLRVPVTEWSRESSIKGYRIVSGPRSLPRPRDTLFPGSRAYCTSTPTPPLVVGLRLFAPVHRGSPSVPLMSVWNTRPFYGCFRRKSYPGCPLVHGPSTSRSLSRTASLGVPGVPAPHSVRSISFSLTHLRSLRRGVSGAVPLTRPETPPLGPPYTLTPSAL